jgi:hypothetical protein
VLGERNSAGMKGLEVEVGCKGKKNPLLLFRQTAGY